MSALVRVLHTLTLTVVMMAAAFLGYRKGAVRHVADHQHTQRCIRNHTSSFLLNTV